MPALQTQHPVPEQLSAFGLGRLSDEDSQQIELHLADCEVCRKQLEELPADSLVSLLQATASDTLDGSLPSDSTADAKADEVAPAPDGSLPPLYKKMAQIISGKPQEQKRPAPKVESVAATVVKPNFTVPRELEAHARYDVLAPLGAGGMGTVYKAQHRLMERVVALKIVNPLLVNKPGAAERFTREVKAAAQLVHPNIVTAYDAENVNGLLLLVMEHVEGQSLADVLGGRRELPIAKACEYVRQTALGLQHALERGMVHRDIKPQNLMLQASPVASAPGVIKILDFGLARFVSEQAQSDGSTEHGSLMGSPDYMAPEQAQDAHSADARADIYSMGCTLYQLLAGQVPFPESSLLKKLEAHRDKQALALNLLRADVSPELAKVVEKMMAKDPAQRYQTPAEVAEALAPFTTMKTIPMPAKPQAAPLHRRPKFIAALAVCLLLVGGGIFLAPYVLRVQTEKGTLIITSDDPDVQIEVKQGGKTVVLFFPKEKKQIELKAGEYTVELVGGKQGLKLSTNKFRIENGENKTVTVEFVPNPIPMATNPPTPLAFPFSAEDGQKNQKEWAAFLKREVVETNSLDMKLALIPPGEFPMMPEYRVRLTKPFYLGVHNVTVGQFRQFVKETGYRTNCETNGGGSVYSASGFVGKKAEYIWSNRDISPTDEHPVLFVSYDDALKYCAWLGRKENKNYRLPTVAEWEWASRGGAMRDLKTMQARSWFAAKSGKKSQPIGKSPADVFGLCDMLGNAQCICHDWHGPQPKGLLVDPKGPAEGQTRVTRGGGHYHDAATFAEPLSDWAVAAPNLGTNGFGIRVACDLAAPAAIQAEPSPEIPSVADLLKTREVLTVAQDGSGGFKTIQEALDKVQAGQVILINGKGPYRESPRKELPADVAIVSLDSTRIEVGNWEAWPDAKIPAWWHKGAWFQTSGSFRMSGLNWFALPAPKDASGLLVDIVAGGDTIVDHCIFDNPHSGYSLNFRGNLDEARKTLFQENYITGIDIHHDAGNLVVQRNWFGKSVGAVVIDQHRGGSIVFRENFVQNNRIVLDLQQLDKANPQPGADIRITNNVILADDHGLSIVPYGTPPLLPRSIQVANNIIRSRDGNGIGIEASLFDRVKSQWRIGPNAYQVEPKDRPPDATWPLKKGDIVQAKQFIAVDPTSADYLRIAADGLLATGGAGGDLPTYLGAFPPGPAPKDGDWFAMLMARRAECGMSPPPSVEDLLKSREVLTVAQDGKSMYTTLGAALDKAKAGQVIHVLDKGPYRESLIREVPENIALVSQAGTRIEVSKWHRWGPEPNNKDKSIYQGLILWSQRGMRLSGFEIICPELPADASGSVAVEFPMGGEVVVESCRIVHTPSYERDKTPKAWSGELFNSLRLGRNDADAGGRQIVRNCHLEGTVDFGRGNATEVVMERNRVLAHRLSVGVGLGAMRAGKAVIRHNVIHAFNGIYVGPQEANNEAKASYLIANNVLDVTNSALWATDYDKAVVPKAVRIHNNIIHSRNKNGLEVTTAAFPKVKDVWQVSHNCYRFNPNERAKQADFVLLATGATDQIRATQFLSDDRADVTNYLHIAADSPLGNAGVGGDLPKYIGAFPPGPAPQDGDWFTRWSRTFTWPADALREGRITVPDLSKLKQHYKDEFDDVKTKWPQETFMGFCKTGYDHGKFFIHYDGSGGTNWGGPGVKNLPFVCQVVGRVTGADSNRWILVIANDKNSVNVNVSGGGKVDVSFHDGRVYRVPPFHAGTHSAIKAGKEFNTLTAILRSRRLEIYINNIAVCDPLMLDSDFEATALRLGLEGQNCRAEFERITVWSAEGLPTPEERLQKGEVPFKVAPKPPFAWPVDALQEGRIPAPDLRNAKVLARNEFFDPKLGFKTGKDDNWEFRNENGKHIIRVKPGIWRGYWSQAGPFGALSVQVEGRVTESMGGQWAVEIQNRDRKRGIYFKLNGKQQLEIWPSGTDMDKYPAIGPIEHRAIKPGAELNKLMIVARGQRYEVYVNDIAVCDPITTDYLTEPNYISLGVFAHKDTTQGEFERVTVWSAEGLPTPEERLQKGDVPVKVAPIDKVPKKGGGDRPDFSTFFQLTAEASFGKYISDLAQIAGNPDVQAELKMMHEQIRKALHAHYEMNYQFAPISSAITTTPELAAKQYGERSAAIEKGLTEILKADQRRRLREIMLQIAHDATPSPRIRFGPASYPGVAETIKLTPDQKAKLFAGTKPADVLTAEQQTAIKGMFGEPYRGQWAPTLALGPAAGAGGSPGNDHGNDLPVLLRNIAEASFGKYVSDLAHVALNADLQAELKLTPEQVQRAQKAHSSMKPVSSGGPGWSLAVGKKQAEAQSQEIEKAIADIVTELQKMRLRQIMIQIYDAPTSAANARMRHGVVAYPGVAEAIELTAEQKKRILTGTWFGDVLNDKQKSAIQGMFGNPYQGRMTPLVVAKPREPVKDAPTAP